MNLIKVKHFPPIILHTNGCGYAPFLLIVISMYCHVMNCQAYELSCL